MNHELTISLEPFASQFSTVLFKIVCTMNFNTLNEQLG